MINTVIETEMNDGSVLKMTLNFKSLYLLRDKNKKIYNEYMRIANGPKDEMEVAIMLYAAYLCANLEDYDNCIKLEDFLENLPVNREEMSGILARLQPKKK